MGNKARIILVISEPLFADGIINAIQMTNDLQLVATANNSVDAVILARKLKPDMAIIDFGGHQLMKDLKQSHKSIAILVLTRRANPPCLAEALQVGIAGCILRSATPTELLTAIRGVCVGEAVLNLEIIKSLLPQLGYPAKDMMSADRSEFPNQQELEALKLASKGLSNKEISRQLFISERTVQSHLGALFRKFAVGSRTEAVVYALRNNFIGLEDLP